MLSYFGRSAELAHSEDCSKPKLPTHACSTFCPLAHSMSYIANAFTSRPTSAKSMLSLTGTQASSSVEQSTPEDVSGGESLSDETRATSVTTTSEARTASTPSVKSKTKTVFYLAHPPPVSIHKQHLHIRPRVLLQLQCVTAAARPTPVLEVLPSFIFASKLARRFPRTFKGKIGLGVDDLVIVSSENYNSDESEGGGWEGIFEAEKWDEREIIAAICQPLNEEMDNRGKVQICLNNGLLWTVSHLASGAYEFTAVDEHGERTIARWVPRQPRTIQRASTTPKEWSSSEEKKFNFSLLNPNSRRHAVIASMDRHSIDVATQYTDPTSWTPTLSSSPTSQECRWKEPVQVSQSLKTLITVTGICVAFQEGFSKYSRHSDNLPSSPNPGTRQRRSLTLSSSVYGATQPLSPAQSSFDQRQKVRANLQHTNSSSAVPLSPRSSIASTSHRRTMSTTGAILQRIKSRNISGPNSSQLSPVGHDDGDDDDMYQTSMRKGSSRTSSGSSLYSSAASSRMEDGSPLETVPSSGLDITEETAALSLSVIKKPRKLSRLFGSSRKSNETSN